MNCQKATEAKVEHIGLIWIYASSVKFKSILLQILNNSAISFYVVCTSLDLVIIYQNLSLFKVSSPNGNNGNNSIVIAVIETCRNPIQNIKNILHRRLGYTFWVEF